MKNLPVAFLRLDRAARITAANPAAEGLLGTSARRLRGTPLARFLPDEAGTLRQAQGQESSVSKAKAPLIDAHGGRTHVALHISADWEGEASTGWTIVILPLMDAHMSARASALKQQAGAISAMNAMLAHEIKNPLAAIRGAAQLMAAQQKSEAHTQQGDLAGLIIAESDRISALIDTMALFTTWEEVGDRACNIHTVLNGVLDGIAASVGQGHRLVPDYDPSLPEVQANAMVLHRVLTNLVKNACEACGAGGGHIQIKTRYVLSDLRPLSGGKAQTHLPICVRIIDNGSGVPEAMADRIFNAFISTKDQGRGLGLAYVAQAVADMGGVIELKTDPGRTEFLLRLPAVQKDA